MEGKIENESYKFWKHVHDYQFHVCHSHTFCEWREIYASLQTQGISTPRQVLLVSVSE